MPTHKLTMFSLAPHVLFRNDTQLHGYSPNVDYGGHKPMIKQVVTLLRKGLQYLCHCDHALGMVGKHFTLGKRFTHISIFRT